MKKPEIHELMDYLYGEGTPAIREQVEQYLAENPKVRAELEQLGATRNMLSNYEDKEVLPPETLSSSENNSGSSEGVFYKRLAAIAASVALIMVFAYALSFNVELSEGRFALSFGKQQVEKETITVAQVQALLDKQQREQLVALNALKADVEQIVGNEQQVTNNKFDQQAQQYLAAYQQQLKKFEKQQQQEIQLFTNAAVGQQNTEIKNLMVDFANYLEEQRIQDREFYLNRLIDLKHANDLQNSETEELLTRVINRVENLPVNEVQNF